MFNANINSGAEGFCICVIPVAIPPDLLELSMLARPYVVAGYELLLASTSELILPVLKFIVNCEVVSGDIVHACDTVATLDAPL